MMHVIAPSTMSRLQLLQDHLVAVVERDVLETRDDVGACSMAAEEHEREHEITDEDQDDRDDDRARRRLADAGRTAARREPLIRADQAR